MASLKPARTICAGTLSATACKRSLAISPGGSLRASTSAGIVIPKITADPSSPTADTRSTSKLPPCKYPMRSGQTSYVVLHQISKSVDVGLAILDSYRNDELSIGDLHLCSIANADTFRLAG